ncbi:MAG: DUF2442 domain-containing protein [Ignavibacteriae bacterium]|nr:DUF2442 domain-containing protein [Ignavibacteriota bacterium]
MKLHPTQVKALPNYLLWIKFNDGTEGTVSLSDIAGQGVFEPFTNQEFFRQVYIDKQSGAIAWNEELDIDSLSLYLEIKGLNFEEYLNQGEPEYATH